MNLAWLKTWTDSSDTVLRCATVDVKSSAGGDASLEDLKAYVRDEGRNRWSLFEIDTDYVIVKLPLPVIMVHLGTPALFPMD